MCHILFLQSVEYSEYAEVAGTPPPGCTEIPTCPVCLGEFRDFFFFFFFMCFLFVPGNDVRNWLWVYVSYFYFNAREVGP